MPPIETIGCIKKAVLWSFSGRDKYGQPVVSAAEEINVRWEPSRREILGEQSQPIATDVDVMVEQEITLGSIMRKGFLADVPSPADNLYEVIAYDETDDIKGVEVQRNVTLRRWKDGLPSIV